VRGEEAVVDCWDYCKKGYRGFCWFLRSWEEGGGESFPHSVYVEGE